MKAAFFTEKRMKREKAVWHRIRRILLALILLILCLSLSGILYQKIASALDASRYPPIGKRIDLGSYRLYLHCTGINFPGRPTVILEAGLGDTSLVWSKVQPEVAAFARVCSYDRAGYGWSDNGSLPRTAERMIQEMDTLLTTAGVPGPYVLVGHSYGGFLMHHYTSTYPQQVVGLVLVDAAHPEQYQNLELRQEMVKARQRLSPCLPSAPFGIMRIFGLLDGLAAMYPPAVQPMVKAHLYQTRFCQTIENEYAVLEESFTQVSASQRSFGDLPLVVLTHGLPLPDPQAEQAWQALQKDLATNSSNSTHRIATGSGHHIHLEQPDLVTTAIRQVLNQK